MNWRVRKVFWKRLFVSLLVVTGGGIFLQILREPLFCLRVRTTTSCIDCGSQSSHELVSILDQSLNTPSSPFRPTSLSRALAPSGSDKCQHEYFEITSHETSWIQAWWPPFGQHRSAFPLENLAAILTQTAKTNIPLARSSLRYALAGEPSDIIRSNLLARRDFVGLVDFVQKTNVSYEPANGKRMGRFSFVPLR